MTDRPILFSGPTIRALLDGRKTQTRRIIKDRGALPEFCGGRYDDKNDPAAWGWEDTEQGCWVTLDQFRRHRFVPIATGDRLYVREAFSGLYEYEREKWPPAAWFKEDAIWYWADGDPTYGDWTRPKPSIHMPRWASRLTLTATDVRVQRLQDISEADAVAEGIKEVSEEWPGAIKPAYQTYGQTACYGGPGSSRLSFMSLWNSLHGPDSWDANPWVAAYTFTVQRTKTTNHKWRQK